MATFYHHSHGTTEIPSAAVSTAAPDHLHHTLILMNPNFAGTGYPTSHPPQAQSPAPSSHNILLLNSAAAAAAAASIAHPSPPLHHQFVRPLPPQQDSIALYGYPQPEARDVTRPRQGLSLSLSSQNPPYGIQPPEADVEAGGQSSVLGSKYLKAAQELLEEVVSVGHGLLAKNSDSPKKAAQPFKGMGESFEEKAEGGGGSDGNGSCGSGGVQLSSAERQELQMKKAKLVTMLDEAEQRYRQYHNQMQIVIASFEQAAGVGSAKTYTALALKTISKQFRCLKDAIQTQIRAAGKSLGEGGGGGSGLNGIKMEGSRLKYIDHQIRQQRALQQLGMMQNHNAWRPQRGLPERSVSVLRAWLFEHFLHPYPKDSDKIMLAKQTGLTRSQVSNWFINARVRLWKPMIEEMYSEEIKEQEQNGGSEEKPSSKENSNGSNSATDPEKNTNIIADQNQTKGNLKDQNLAVSSPCSSPSLIPIPTSSSLPFKGGNNTPLSQNQHGFDFSGSLEMEGITQGGRKRARNEHVVNCGETDFIKFGNEKQGRENNGYPMLSGGAMNFVGGGEELEFNPTIGEMGRFPQEFNPTRFFPGNGISLSLGLPPCENQQLNLSATSHTFLSPSHNINFRRPNEFGSINSPPPHSTAAAFECLDIQNRKGFAAQLLPDFVA